MPLFGTWLNDERRRISVNDVDLRFLVSSAYRLSRYTRVYLASTQIALDDALVCIPLLDAEDEGAREAWEENREAFVDHLTEAVFRLTHILVAVGCSGEELADRYQKLLPAIPGDNAEDGTDGSPDSDEASTLCADVPESLQVVEK